MSIDQEFPELFSEAFDVCLPQGWTEIARQTCEEIVAIDPAARVKQLKEKFGGAQLYLDTENPDVRRVVDAFEAVSVRVCQVCGKQGRIRSGSWVRTLCEEHAK